MNLHFHHRLFCRLKIPIAKAEFIRALELLDVSSVFTWTMSGALSRQERLERSTADFRGLAVPSEENAGGLPVLDDLPWVLYTLHSGLQPEDAVL